MTGSLAMGSNMTTVVVKSSQHVSRKARVVLPSHRLLSATSTAATKPSQSRLEALRERIRDEDREAIRTHDVLFSEDISYGTAVPRRTRDKEGKVRNLTQQLYPQVLLNPGYRMCHTGPVESTIVQREWYSPTSH